MSRTRKFIGFWIVLILSLGVVPYIFYLMSRTLDNLLSLQPISYPISVNVFAAAACALVGLFWILWAYSYLHFVGKGTPVEAFGVALYPTRYLVTTGPYAYTRNPMMLGLLFLLLAVAFYIASVCGLILVPILSCLAVAYLKIFEEPALVSRFGSDYEKYRSSVPVLIPALRR